MAIQRVLKYGMRGEDVKEWQQVLIAAGHDLYPFFADGHFGDATHNATIAWQKARNLKGDGVVGPITLAKVSEKPITQSDPLKEELNIKFVQAKNYTKANRTEIKWIVLHSMEAGEASTTAENVANWFAGSSAPQSSAHYNIDDDSIVQSVKDEDVAWHAKAANRYGIGLEHAGFARQTREQWLDSFSMRMLKRSAKLTAELCKKWNIPAEYVDAKGLAAGECGITTHNDVTKGLKSGNHWDPGPNFPMDLYIQWVKESI